MEATNVDFGGQRSTFLLYVSDKCPVELRRKQYQLGDFEVVKQLESGVSSLVCEAKDLVSGCSCAVKVYNKDTLSPMKKRQVEREMELHSRLCSRPYSHENILDLYVAFEEREAYVIVMHYCDGLDLWEVSRRRRGVFTEQYIVSKVIFPLLHVTCYLHNHGLMHRDIKPENILFHGADRSLRLADFGLAIDTRHERPVTRLGTLEYMSPEVLRSPYKKHPDQFKDQPGYDGRSDAWAIGVLSYELLAGKSPFGKQNKELTAEAILTQEPMLLYTLSAQAKDFLRLALAKDPEQRGSVHQLLGHAWLRHHATDAQRLLLQEGSDANAASSSLTPPVFRTPSPLRIPSSSRDELRQSNSLTPQSSISPHRPGAEMRTLVGDESNIYTPHSGVSSARKPLASAASDASALARQLPTTTTTGPSLVSADVSRLAMRLEDMLLQEQSSSQRRDMDVGLPVATPIRGPVAPVVMASPSSGVTSYAVSQPPFAAPAVQYSPEDAKAVKKSGGLLGFLRPRSTAPSPKVVTPPPPPPSSSSRSSAYQPPFASLAPKPEPSSPESNPLVGMNGSKGSGSPQDGRDSGGSASARSPRHTSRFTAVKPDEANSEASLNRSASKSSAQATTPTGRGSWNGTGSAAITTPPPSSSSRLARDSRT